MKYRTPLHTVRGLGSAKDGTHHWWMQRVTAIALVPLTLWFAFFLARIASLDYPQAVDWVRSPVVSVLLIATLAATFYHAKLGLQVVIEDYVHQESIKIASLVVLKLAAWLLGLTSIVAVLRVALSG